MFIISYILCITVHYALLVGGFNLTPPKNMKVKWDYCSQLNAKMKKVLYHQPGK